MARIVHRLITKEFVTSLPAETLRSAFSKYAGITPDQSQKRGLDSLKSPLVERAIGLVRGSAPDNARDELAALLGKQDDSQAREAQRDRAMDALAVSALNAVGAEFGVEGEQFKKVYGGMRSGETDKEQKGLEALALAVEAFWLLCSFFGLKGEEKLLKDGGLIGELAKRIAGICEKATCQPIMEDALEALKLISPVSWEKAQPAGGRAAQPHKQPITERRKVSEEVLDKFLGEVVGCNFELKRLKEERKFLLRVRKEKFEQLQRAAEEKSAGEAWERTRAAEAEKRARKKLKEVDAELRGLEEKIKKEERDLAAAHKRLQDARGW